MTDIWVLRATGYIVRKIGEFKAGVSISPSSLEVDDDNGVRDPDQRAPSPRPNATISTTYMSRIFGRVLSSRGIDKAAQKLRIPTDVDLAAVGISDTFPISMNKIMYP